MRQSALERASEAVRAQRHWIEEHGGDEAGYIARYGPADGDPERRVEEGGRYGLGGRAIHAADVAALAHYEAELDRLLAGAIESIAD